MRLRPAPFSRKISPILVLIAIGFLPAIAASAAVGRTYDAWWYLGEAVLGTFGLVVGAFSATRAGAWLAKLATAAVVALLLAVTGYYVASLTGLTGSTTQRFVFGFGTYVLLGDSLVMLAVMLWVLRLVRTGWIFLLAFVAQVSAATRTSTVAIVVGALVALLAGPTKNVYRRYVIGALVVAVTLLGAAVFLYRPDNLIVGSATMSGWAWHVRRSEVTRSRSTQSGPEPHNASWPIHVKAKRNPGIESSWFISQPATPGLMGKPYVASAYLRADNPTSVTLGSGLASRTCRVTRAWERCVTPAASGDGYTSVGFYLEFPPGSTSLEFDIWGPQVEQARTAGPVIQTARRTTLNSFLDRFRNPRAILIRDFRPRFATMRAAWSMFLSRPWSGVGMRGWARAYASTTAGKEYPGLPDAHDQVLYALATGGIFALVALLLPTVGTLILLRHAWRRWAPMAVVLLLITIFDVTFYFSYIYISFWFAAGYLSESRWRLSGPPS